MKRSRESPTANAMASAVQFCNSSELNPFEQLIKQVAVVKGDRHKVHPTNAINDNCIEFDIAAGPDFTDLSQSFLEVKLKIVSATNNNQNPTAVAATEKVGPINNVMHSLFSQVDVYINNTLTSSTDNLYPYRAYLENLLSYSAEAKDEQLWGDGWCNDEAGNMDVSDPTLVTAPAAGSTAAVNGNAGLKTRHARLAGKSVTYHGRLHCDIFHQDKLILDGCNIKIKLIRNKAPFILQSAASSPNYRVFMESAIFHVWRKQIHPDILMPLTTALKTRPAQYNLKRVDMKTFTVPVQTTTHNLTLYKGQLPSLIILGLVSNTALNGSYTENPLNFKHFGVTLVELQVNGNSVNAFKFDGLNFTNGDYNLAYDSIRTAMHKSFKNTSVGIKPEEYGKGYTLYAFDLTPNDPAGHSGENPEGEIRLNLAFTEALTNAATLVCYAETDAIFTIDHTRTCVRAL